MEILFEERKKKKRWAFGDCELVYMGDGLTMRTTLLGVIKLQRFGPAELRKEMKEKEI